MFRSASRNNVGKNALQKNACRKQVSEMRLPKKKHVAAEIQMLKYCFWGMYCQSQHDALSFSGTIMQRSSVVTMCRAS